MANLVELTLTSSLRAIGIASGGITTAFFSINSVLCFSSYFWT
jgi:hypothetical protein